MIFDKDDDGPGPNGSDPPISDLGPGGHN